MTDSFLGEIRLFSAATIPSGWMACTGQLLAIQQYAALYALLGTRFGGNGSTNFALPDLRGRTVVGSSSANVGQSGGSETVTLNPAQLPPHTHSLVASSAVAAGSPLNNLYAKPTPNPKATNPPAARPVYQTNATTFTPLNSFAITSTGGGAAHENRQPYLALNWCICTSGLFPARN